MESTCIRLRIVAMVYLDCTRRTSLRRSISAVFIARCFRRGLVADVGCSDDCSADNGAVCSAIGVAGGTTASGSVDNLAPALALSFFSVRRLDFLTKWMVDTLRKRDTFLLEYRLFHK